MTVMAHAAATRAMRFYVKRLNADHSRPDRLVERQLLVPNH